MTNADIARKLREHATELSQARENLYRVRAFRQAAMAVMGMSDEVERLVAADGPRALERVPGIGKSLADTIAHFAAGADGQPVSVSRHRSRRGANSWQPGTN
jgi:DNA polymerase/3'-5' exonuclease PolX